MEITEEVLQIRRMNEEFFFFFCLVIVWSDAVQCCIQSKGILKLG